MYYFWAFFLFFTLSLIFSVLWGRNQKKPLILYSLYLYLMKTVIFKIFVRWRARVGWGARWGREVVTSLRVGLSRNGKNKAMKGCSGLRRCEMLCVLASLSFWCHFLVGERMNRARVVWFCWCGCGLCLRLVFLWTLGVTWRVVYGVFLEGRGVPQTHRARVLAVRSSRA